MTIKGATDKVASLINRGEGKLETLKNATMIFGKDGITYSPVRFIEAWSFWFAVDAEGKSRKLRWNDIESFELPDGTMREVA